VSESLCIEILCIDIVSKLYYGWKSTDFYQNHFGKIPCMHGEL